MWKFYNGKIKVVSFVIKSDKGNNKITEHRAIFSQQTDKISQQPEKWENRNGPDRNLTIGVQILAKCQEMRQRKVFLLFHLFQVLWGILMESSLELLIDRISPIYLKVRLKAMVSVFCLSLISFA